MKKHVQIAYKGSEDASIYVLDGNKENFTISSSSLDKGWSRSNVEFLSLKDDGNGISVKMDNRRISLDYHEVELLRIALRLNDGSVSIKEIELKPYRRLE